MFDRYIVQRTVKMLCKFNFRVEIKLQVEEVSNKLGLQANQVFPVRSYSMETECNLHIDILNLRAQRQILRNSRSYLKDKIKFEEAIEMNSLSEATARAEEGARRKKGDNKGAASKSKPGI